MLYCVSSLLNIYNLLSSYPILGKSIIRTFRKLCFKHFGRSLGYFGPLSRSKNDPKGPKWHNLISPEQLIVKAWLSPQNDRKHQVSISVWYNIYPSENRKYPFLSRVQKRAKSPYSRSHEPLNVEGGSWMKGVVEVARLTCLIQYIKNKHFLYTGSFNFV